MCEVVSLHPTTTTLKLPAACAAVNVAVTTDCGDCGTALFTCTNAGAASADVMPNQVTASSAAFVTRAAMPFFIRQPATQWLLLLRCSDAGSGLKSHPCLERRAQPAASIEAHLVKANDPVSYTHLTLPTSDL